MSNQPTSENKNDGLKLYNGYITTALKCVPPGDKPTFLELRTCFNYFKQEIDLLKNVKIIIALGKIAFDACIQFYKETYFLKIKITCLVTEQNINYQIKNINRMLPSKS